MTKSKETLKRIAIFQDTLKRINENSILSSSADAAIEDTKIFDCSVCPIISPELKERNQSISVTQHRSFEAASILHKQFPDKKIAVLNFGNAFYAGGGVNQGASAQEESLCRTSTLYHVLNSQRLFRYFYKNNRTRTKFKGQDLIAYTPDIIVFKSDTLFPETLPESEWFKVDIITAAAPDLRRPMDYQFPTENYYPVSDAELFAIHVKRAVHILSVAAFMGADILVLGAFGCGAFKNDPRVVADAYKTVLNRFPKYFSHIEFAVYCGEDLTNFNVFNEVLG